MNAERLFNKLLVDIDNSKNRLRKSDYENIVKYIENMRNIYLAADTRYTDKVELNIDEHNYNNKIIEIRENIDSNLSTIKEILILVDSDNNIVYTTTLGRVVDTTAYFIENCNNTESLRYQKILNEIRKLNELFEKQQ